VYLLKGEMNTVVQMTIQDALQKLAQHGLKECRKEVRSQGDRNCLYVFERIDDEGSVFYDCETVDDVFALLSLVEASAPQ
jgi:hypothetical protein